MRTLLLLLTAIFGPSIAGLGAFCWWQSSPTPSISSETVQLTESKRTRLISLRTEHKFQPHSYPPLGYTGAETAEDEKIAVEAVDGVIEAILSRPEDFVSAKVTSSLIGRGMEKVEWLATEDRERAAGYMIEIWYILGFHGSTGRFGHGSAFTPPPGYAEPLPPGWISPDQPRVIRR